MNQTLFGNILNIRKHRKLNKSDYRWFVDVTLRNYIRRNIKSVYCKFRGGHMWEDSPDWSCMRSLCIICHTKYTTPWKQYVANAPRPK